MLASILTAMAGFIVATISAGGYLGIAVLMAIESACIPLPSEIIMPFAGYLASTGRFNLARWSLRRVRSAATLALPSPTDRRIGGRPLVERWGRYVLVGPTRFDRADRFFAHWGGVAVFISPADAGRPHLHRPAGRHRPHAQAALPGLHLPRLLALVLRPGLCRLRARRALGHRPATARLHAPVRCRNPGRTCGAPRLVRLAALAPAAAYRGAEVAAPIRRRCFPAGIRPCRQSGCPRPPPSASAFSRRYPSTPARTVGPAPPGPGPR